MRLALPMRRLWVATLVVLLAFWLSTAPQRAQAAATPAAPPSASPAVLLAEWQWWTDMKDWFASQATNRSRVVQFGLAGMVIALIILYSASNRKR